jgi:NAD(P)H-dependent FMN reductase
MPKIHVIVGSTRPGRVSEGIAKWALGIAQRLGLDAELVDLRDWPLPFYAEVGPPKMLGGQYSTPVATKWAAKVKEADGYLIVTPEYNHGYPAVLKNALDYCYDEWNGKPVAFVSYGGVAAGTRSVGQLRQVVAELQMFDLRDAVHIPFVNKAIDAAGAPQDPGFTKAAELTLAKLVAAAEMMKPSRP